MNSPIDVQQLARLGAIARLKELEEEAAAIRRMFPNLNVPAGKRSANAPSAAPKTAKRKKRARQMSPEARKAASERMRAYWAKKRAQ